VQRLLQIGLSLEQISIGLDLPIEEVRKIAEQS
jgi:predicted transposase YdaD